MAYDVQRDEVVLFGGTAGGGGMMDSWRWNGSAWSSIVGAQPPGRWGHGMVYDRARDCIVLFGGFVPNGGVADAQALGDTWEWNGSQWLQRTPLWAPSPRGAFGMVFDTARNRTVLFGGGNGAAGALYNDTWEWNGTNWAAIPVAPGPTPRRGVGMAFDWVRNQCVVFGGRNGNGVLGDTWTYSVLPASYLWQQQAPATSPPARAEAAMLFDPLCGVALLGCGQSGSVNGSATLSDWWGWNGANWAPFTGPVGAVTSRSGAATAYDFRRGRSLLFGGRSGGGTHLNATFARGGGCNRGVSTQIAPVLGTTARYRYSYPAFGAGNLGLWLVTAPTPLSVYLPFGPFYVHNDVAVDIAVQLGSAAFLTDGTGAATFDLPIPAQPNLIGLNFDVQALDLNLGQDFLHWSDSDVTATVLSAPIASFTATGTTGNAPLVVQFTDASAGSPTSWQWDFDNDGVVDSTLQNPSRTYASNGVYSVRLVATNAYGSGSVTREHLVYVGGNAALGLVPIAPGAYTRGIASVSTSAPEHLVTISAPFWMSRHEITQSRYQQVMGVNPSIFVGPAAPDAPNRPVETVTWHDAVQFCRTLTATERLLGRVPAGYEYRLPTDAEWEYCCRAGTTTSWNTGSSLSTSQANFNDAFANAAYPAGQTCVVGFFPPNAWGLHDMHGNVSEWCIDSAAPYASGPMRDPCVTGGSQKAVRGGTWWMNDALFLRSGIRISYTPNNTHSGQGFRIVLAPTLLSETFTEMVRIVPGSFQMGSTAGNPDEQPVHAVTLTAPFWMAKHEVTQALYQAVTALNPSFFQGPAAPGAAQRPVESVSWNAAAAFCAAVNASELAAGRVPVGYQYRLPTEAEWEYCCRAGTTTEWHTGANLTTAQANFGGVSANATYPAGQSAAVGSYAPNPWGIYDMHGNVAEWCLDYYSTYPAAPQTNPYVGSAPAGTSRVDRGGTWYFNDFGCRSAWRGGAPATGAFNFIGFRMVLAPILVP